MNEEILNTEDVLESETLNEDYVSSSESVEIGDKLDRIEALLNEDIALREQEEVAATVPVLDTGSGASTSSGAVGPNYNQYIYDLLTDSTVKVEIVEQENIVHKKINDYSTIEVLMLMLLILGLTIAMCKFFEKHVFKRRR